MYQESPFRWLLALAIVAFASCKKDDDPTRTEILTSGQWRLTAAVANPPVTVPGFPPVSDIYAFLPACNKDNIYVFKADGTAEINEGPTKCAPADPQATNTTWALSADERELTLGANKLTILEISGNQMRVNGTATVQGVTATADLTFTK